MVPAHARAQYGAMTNPTALAARWILVPARDAHPGQLAPVRRFRLARAPASSLAASGPARFAHLKRIYD